RQQGCTLGRQLGPRMRLGARAAVTQDRPERRNRDGRLLLARLRSGQDQQRVEQSLEPPGRLLDVLQEAVAIGGIVLGSVLEHLDCARDRGDRSPQLVGCVLHEVLVVIVPAAERLPVPQKGPPCALFAEYQRYEHLTSTI